MLGRIFIVKALYCSVSLWSVHMLWDALDINNFILFYFILLLYFFFILFFFGDDERGMWQGSHMIGHMMWHHRPRTWWKNLEGDVRVHRVCMVALSKKWGEHDVKIVDGGLHFFIFSFHFIFLFFYIFRTTQVRVYQSHCHISHKLMAKSQDWSRDLEEWSRRFWNKVTSYNIDNICWPYVIHMVIRVGCTAVSMDHE